MISVFVTSYLLQKPFLICNAGTHSLVCNFVTTPKNLAEEDKLKICLRCLDSGSISKKNLNV